jgi:hypothetical protein
METNKRQQTLILFAVAALVLLLGDSFVRAPLYTRWVERSAHIDQLKKSISQGELTVSRDASIRGRWEKMRSNTLSNNVSIAESQLLKAFDQWTRDSRVTIGSIRPQWKQPEDDYTTLECRADATGSIDALSRFLYEVEKDPLALKVESIEITSHDDSGRQLTLALQLNGLMLTPPTP